MNTVRFFRRSDGKLEGFSSCGHSGYAEAGEDIVCAGISALVINTVNSLEQLTDARMQLVTEEEAGRIDCRVQNFEEENIQLLLQSLSIGLKDIQNQYGADFIQVFFEEV